MKLLAIDPGVTTGYCLATTMTQVGAGGLTSIELKPFQSTDDVDDVWHRLEEIEPRYIVCEDFEFRQKSRAGLNLYPVQVIGVVRLYELLAEHQVAAHIQKASTGKGYYTNVLLKKLNVYKPGAAWEHSMDATRHLLHWLTFGSGYQLTEGKQMQDILRLVT